MPGQPAIELHSSLTPGDLARFQYFHVWRKSWKPVLVVAVSCIALGVYGSEAGVLPSRAVLFIPLLLCAVALLVSPYWTAIRQWKTQRYLAEPIRQTFTPQVIRLSAASTSSEIAWSAIREIYENGALFLVYFAPNQAIIVPKRFFPDDATMQSWKQLAKSQTPRFIENHFIGRWF